MNVGEEHNAFSDVPGFESSKGERIIKALQRLWMKIQHLEQVRNSEKKTLLSDGQTSVNADLTLTDVQFKLLVLQLQYVRSILKKNHNDLAAANEKDSALRNIVDKPFIKNIIAPTDSNSYDSGCCENVISSKETQTGVSLIEGFSNNALQYKENADQKITEVPTNDSRSVADSASGSSTHMSASPKLSSQPHYHLKLDDVPFILGASSSASHSVVANVQNIIAMMKSHNRALCGPKTRNQHSSTSKNTNLNQQDSLDTNKMLKELSKELSELTMRQKKLEQILDNAQNKDHFKDTECRNKLKADSSINVASTNRLRSVSDSSVKLPADVKQHIKSKGKEISKRCHSQSNHVMPRIRGHSNNGATVVRRKILRSLQDFKTHLSEDDISWN